MKKILITGGLGFIGTHCIEQWKSLGWKVWIIDNLSSNAIESTHELAGDSEVIISDILKVDWGSLPKFDLILHLASPVGPVGVLKHSGMMARIILDDIYWAIDGANKNNCPLIFISTSEIYGYREHKSYLEEKDDKVLHGEVTVRNEYATAKLLSEIVLSNHAKINTSFRYQSVNGEIDEPVKEQALKNEDITVYYSGQQLRAFTWVKDIVNGIYLASTAPAHLWNQEWNIGNELNEQTIIYLAEKVKKFTFSTSKIIHIDPKELHGHLFSEAPEKIPNSEKIKTQLGWKPTKYVDDVIQEVIDFYKEKM